MHRKRWLRGNCTPDPDRLTSVGSLTSLRTTYIRAAYNAAFEGPQALFAKGPSFKGASVEGGVADSSAGVARDRQRSIERARPRRTIPRPTVWTVRYHTTLIIYCAPFFFWLQVPPYRRYVYICSLYPDPGTYCTTMHVSHSQGKDWKSVSK